MPIESEAKTSCPQGDWLLELVLDALGDAHRVTHGRDAL